jgi:hypothetical protein
MDEGVGAGSELFFIDAGSELGVELVRHHPVEHPFGLLALQIGSAHCWR